MISMHIKLTDEVSNSSIYSPFSESPTPWEFLLWCCLNESDWYQWGCRFDSWPHLVGWGPGIAVSYGVVHRRGLAPTLLWLWCRPAAVALTWPPVWETFIAASEALKRQKKKKKGLPRWYPDFPVREEPTFLTRNMNVIKAAPLKCLKIELFLWNGKVKETT